MKSTTEIVDKLLEGKSLEEQVKILRNCFENHALGHPWADEDFVNSVIENITNEYDIEEQATGAIRIMANDIDGPKPQCSKCKTWNPGVSVCKGCGERFLR